MYCRRVSNNLFSFANIVQRNFDELDSSIGLATYDFFIDDFDDENINIYIFL